MADKELMRERKRWKFLGLPFTFTTFAVTDKKLIIEKGLFTTNEDEILLYKVLDIQYSRTLGQKMFGLGTIKVFLFFLSMPELLIKNIKHSRQFKELLSEQSELEKQRLSVRRGEDMGMHYHDFHHHHDNHTDPADLVDHHDFDDNFDNDTEE